METDRGQRDLLADVVSYASEGSLRLLFAAAVGILVARYLGPEGLGLLSYAGSVFVLLSPLTMLGMRPILVREFSTRGDWQTTLVSALSRQLPAALVSSVIGFAVIVTTRSFDQDAMLIALALAPLPLFALGDTLRTYLEATHRSRWVAVTGILVTGAVSSMKILAIALGAPTWVFALAVTLEAALASVILLRGISARWNPRAAFRHFRGSRASGLLRESWPLLLSGFAVMLYMRADVFMLGLIAGDQSAGIYTAAARLSEVWYFIPVAAAAAVRPRLARLFAEGRWEEYRLGTQRFLSAALGVSLIAVVGVLVFGDQLVIALYGPAFASAGSVLRVHILAAPFVFLGLAAGQWFIDRSMTKIMMARSLVGAGVNVALNLLLIPTHGALGAAAATLVSYAIAGVLYNAVLPAARPAFWMQARAMRFKWR